MKVAILGFARDGQAAYEYWNKQGNELTICDQNESIELPVGTKAQLGDDCLANLDKFDLIVRSAGLSPNLIIKANPETQNILEKVTGNIDEFFRVSPTKNIIGVTGTKGKGTTSTLIAKILEASGKKVHLGGNIGIPALELLKENIQADDWVVLEQSSFQLMDQKHSPHIAVCLMVVSEHLDWHTDLDEYIDAKSQLFIHQTTDDIAIYFADNETSEDIANASEGKIIPFFAPPGAYLENDKIVIEDVEVCKTSELKLLGKHNWQNVCAAVTAVWQISQDMEAIRSVLTSFSGLPFRLELIREVNGVKYYNDSFGTTPETAIVALESFDQPKVLIVGGSSKKSDYSALSKSIKNSNVRSVVVIGDMGPTIAEKLSEIGYNDIVEGGKTMTDIVKIAQTQSKPGDIVLLSTGCASFGLFKNYKDRGEQFNQAVQALV